MDLGVIVGRFQSPFMHHGYQRFFEFVKERHPKNRMVVLGVSPTLGTRRDPLDFETRSAMVLKADPTAIVKSIMDRESDRTWSVALDKLVVEAFPWTKKNLSKVVLYGGRDSFLPRYHGKFKTATFKSQLSVASTKIREQIGRQDPQWNWHEKHLEYFMRGVIYASQKAFPRVFQTVDIAVTRHENPNGTGPLQVLLGWKYKGDELRFPGGFVDPTDNSLELAARRELQEEVPGISVEGPLSCIGSTRIEDWRYKDKDRIMTSFFHGEYTFGHTQAGDDLAGCAWFPLKADTRKKMRVYHQPLYDMLLKYLKDKFLRDKEMERFVEIADANMGWK